MNKEKFMELAMQYSPHAPLEALKRFATALLNEQRERETEPLEKRIDEVLGYWNNSEKQYVDVVAELGMAEKRVAELEGLVAACQFGIGITRRDERIAELETELAHMTMAANSEAQRVNELTAERLAVSPEVVAYLAETNTDLSDPQLYFDREDARRAGFVTPLGRIVPKEQPVAQEPLAWAFTDDPSVFAMPGSGVRAGKEPPEDAINIYPLYAAPVQQVQKVPLTDEQIWKNEDIMAANSGYGASFETLREVIRATESAHGIGGKV